jgi:D-alanine-D-alanine ligase-like ATP-grasp enzyme
MTDRDRFQRPLPWFYTAAAAQLERFVHTLTFPIVVHPARRCSSVAVAVAAVGAMG